MKYTSVLLFFCTSALLTACSSDSDEPVPPEKDDTLVKSEAHMYVYPGVQRIDGTVPRLTIVEGDEMCTELYDPVYPDIFVFHYMNSATQQSAFMTASTDGIAIIEDNPFRPQQEPAVTLVSAEGSDIVVSSGTYSKTNELYSITSVQRIEGASAAKAASVLSRGDDMDFARGLVMKDIIGPLSKATSRGADILKGAPANVLTAWSNWGMPVAESMLYSNNEKDFLDMTAQKVYTTQVKQIKVVKVVTGTVKAAKSLYGAALSAFQSLRSFDEDDYDDVSEQFILTTTDSYSFTSRRVQTSCWEVYDESERYRPDIRLVEVDGQSATVCGNFTDFDGRFTVTGYRIYSDKGGSDKVTATLDGRTTYTFHNLEKGRTYSVTAYATVMGTTYESAPVTFRIDGELEVSESAVTFPDAGGKHDIEVTLPSDDWTWQPTAAASWCKASRINDNTLRIEAASSTESRETTVTVTATSPKGDTLTKTIGVTQTTVGAIALFKGPCTFVTKISYVGAPEYNFTKESTADLVLLMERGATTKLTFALPLSGLTFISWPMSDNRPTGEMVADGVTVTGFNCSATDTLISIDGSTSGPDNCTSEFSVKIDLASLTVKLLESGKDRGTGYPGMGSPTPYTSTSTLSGTLSYTEAYN